jgi:pimeloyl-ACP methyl ester carboxylesterase
VIALNAKPPVTEEEVARRFVENFRLASGASSPFDEDAWLALGRAVAGCAALRADGLTPAMANNSNNTRAQMATEPLRAEDLMNLAMRVLLIHGSEDPIFPIAHARWAAGLIPGAQLAEIVRMGHALDPAFFEPVSSALLRFWRERAS